MRRHVPVCYHGSFRNTRNDMTSYFMMREKNMKNEKEKQKKKDAEEIGELTKLSYDLKGQ